MSWKSSALGFTDSSVVLLNTGITSVLVDNETLKLPLPLVGLYDSVLHEPRRVSIPANKKIPKFLLIIRLDFFKTFKFAIKYSAKILKIYIIMKLLCKIALIDAMRIGRVILQGIQTANGMLLPVREKQLTL